MSTSRITKLFLSSVIACITGGTLVAIAWSGFPRDAFVMNGSQIVAIHGSTFAWTMLAVGAAGVATLVGAAMAGFAAWIGALLNTATLERRRWFTAIALLGVLNCGLLGVFIYLVTSAGRARQTPAAPSLGTAGAS